MEPTEVDEECGKVEAAVAGTRIVLLEHQTHMVYAMLERERTYFEAMSGKTTPRKGIFLWNKGRCIKRERPTRFDVVVEGSATSNACVLADRPGSGKTYEILALLALCPFPGMACEPVDRSDGPYPSPCWRCQYECVHRTNLIFVGKTVLQYWKETIKAHTDLRLLSIEGVKDLRELYDYVFRSSPLTDTRREKGAPPGSWARYTDFRGEERYLRRLNCWDVILVKNGMVSGNLHLPELEQTVMANQKSKSIVSLFGLLFHNQCFGRVILDDYDTLGIPASSVVIPSMFTWYVSATRPARAKAVHRCVEMQNLWDVLRLSRPFYADINGQTGDDFIGCVRVTCETGLLERSLNIASVSHWLYTLENAHDRLIQAVSDMGGEDLAEMLNANALRDAAKAAGTIDLSIAGVFERILQDQYRVYCRLRRSILYAETFLDAEKGLGTEKVLGTEIFEKKAPAEEESVFVFGTHSRERVRQNLDAAGPRRKLLTRYARLSKEGCADMVAFVEEYLEEKRTELGKISGGIRRVRENIVEGECPIMLTPLAESENVYILRCCSVVICEEAAAGIRMEHNREVAATTCPKCRHRVLGADVLGVPQSKLGRLLEEGTEGIEEASFDVAAPGAALPADAFPASALPADAFPASAGKTEEREDPKVRLIMRIVGHEAPHDLGGGKVANPLPGLLEGSLSKGEAPPEDRKYLIFANHEAMLRRICLGLERQHLDYHVLQGKTEQLTETIARYKLPNANPRSYRILLVNGLQYCAGMNLQCTTDLIFCHWVRARNIACQIGGRAARHGRETDLNIHYVLYHNEVELFEEAS